MRKEELKNFLTKFRWIDKYETFSGILPAAVSSVTPNKEVVTHILDGCAYDLLQLLEEQGAPGKMAIRQAISRHMDHLALAAVDTVDKDFGYELFWYLAEKCGTDMRRSSDAKIWGYWKVDSGRVKTVGSVRRRRAKVAG